MGEVCAAADAESLYLFAVRSDGDVMARMFDRGITIWGGPRHRLRQRVRWAPTSPITSSRGCRGR